MALASALQSQGRTDEARALIRHFWRDKSFEADIQSRMVSVWGTSLSADDNNKRLDTLLYGQQGPAVRAMMALVDSDHRALAEARIALRAERGNAPELVSRVPAALQGDPGLSVDRARFYRKRNLDVMAAQLAANFPTDPTPDTASFIWGERRAIVGASIRSGDFSGAYAAATNHGLTSGQDLAEAEFYAGWIALTKLHNPSGADQHFARIQQAGTSPITLSRALYWRGKAAEAMGQTTEGHGYWSQAARYYTAFYGQLAANKLGQTTLSLSTDPVPTSEDRSRFEGRDLVRAARMLAEAGERDAFRAVVLATDDILPNAEELALLVDLARQYGDQDLSMRVVRAGASKGQYLPERGYPVRSTPEGSGVEPAFILAITRQESSFDPHVQSGPGARGMMQLMPGTAAIVARRMGMPYSVGRLFDPEYNMRLGSAFLGQLVEQMGGSYVLAAAAYNAGPGRATQWASQCGDPRGAGTDPSDFIECISIPETRNYVMRILETTQVYHARLNGGTGALTLASDLKRGSYTPGMGASPNGGPVPYEALQAPPGKR